MIFAHSSRRALASANLSARKSASAARTSSSRRRSSAAAARLASDGGKRRATLSGLIVTSDAHENARPTCGSSAALPLGKQTSTRGAAAGANGGDTAAGSPTSGTTGAGGAAELRGAAALAGAAVSRIIAKVTPYWRCGVAEASHKS